MNEPVIKSGRPLRLHLGCGNERLDGFVNIDSRPTPAADLTMDLNVPKLEPASVAMAFSNAFFEHLYRNARLPHLCRIRESLATDGVCCYMGIPYFRNVARFYLEKSAGTAGPVFDLYNVYRYTHGDPDRKPDWWLDQLHKSLFDEVEVSALLRSAGFASSVMFCYGYPRDFAELPVTMGFYATTAALTEDRLRSDCTSFLRTFEDRHIRMKTLEWL